MTVVGCGSGGYAGQALASLSASQITIDAGQSFAVSANDPANLPVSWSLNGPACTGAACGTISNSTGLSTTYTAPSPLSSPIGVTLRATITGTQSNKTVAITVNPAPAIAGATPNGTVGVAYSATLTPSGGTGALKLSLASGSLPAGLTFNAATGVISGTPTQTGTSSFVVQVLDQSDVPDTVTASRQITIGIPSTPLAASGNPPAGTVGARYMTALTASGGTAPYTWTVISGALPAGLSLSSGGIISGTPTSAGNSTSTAQVQDASGSKATATFSIPVTAAQGSVVLTTGTLPNGTVNAPYSGTIGVAGGTAPYTCTINAGTLPAGLTLGAGCVVSGTPTAPGNTTVTVGVTDSGNPAGGTSGPVSITINPSSLNIASGNLPNGTVGTPYNSTVGVTGGTAPYTCTVVAGSLPAGLSFGAGCAVTGTPTIAGTSTPTVRATDSSNPQASTTKPVSITINPAAATIVIASPPAATVNTPYTGTIPVSGGTGPYTCQLTGGTLQPGLTLNSNCQITGTPTTAGTTTVTVKATDSSSPTNTNSAPVTVTVNPGSATLTFGTPPVATINTPYTGTVPVAGGTGPYTCSLTGGTLQAGLTLNNNCQITGTPTVSGTSTIMVKATDSSNPANTNTGNVPVTVNAGGSALTLGIPPAATINTPYTGTVPVSGGTGPYTCALTGGTLQAGLALNNNCTITGTPAVSGTDIIMVKATDSGNPVKTTTGNVPVTVNPAGATLTVGTPPVATVSTPYTGTIPVTGGTGPYNCTLAYGTLPAGITLGSGCVLTGTPTTAGTLTVGITATDSANPVDSTTAPVAITVQPIPALTLTGSLPNGIVNQPYTQTLQAHGGVGPYTYAITAGALPAGLTLSTGGVISGTPTIAGASSFTITATDSEGTPQTASLPLVLLITYPTTPSDALLTGPYAFLFQGYDDVVAGVLAYQTATIGSFTADGAGVLSMGELDSNHQTSNPAGNTIPTRNLLGTYTVGGDGRGSIAITVLNANGTTGATTVYAIALRTPVAPATAANRGTLIEYDGNQLAGTKGTGTLLAQAPAAITAGLNGSYAFGVSGDTPCLPTCTLSLLTAGPVVEVGQFTTAGGAITGGTADTNAAAVNFPNSTLSGTYAGADGNGRVQLTMNTSRLAGSAYPTDFAVYIVDANNAFVMSTDKHSAFVLQAGTARLQTQATFTNASLGAPYVGYENAQANPGLVSGTVLQSVLNFSSATIFEGVGNGDGTCTTRSVTNAGLTGLVNGLTGVVGGTGLLPGILGSYTSTGTSNCTVATNGRAVLNYAPPASLLGGLLGNATPAPRVAYLVSPNTGYFLETSYAGLGMVEAQTGAPFSLATLDGTFVYATIPASTLATIDASGVFTADGAGHTTSTLDENTGVGTLNVLQLGVAGSATYTLTPQPSPYDPAQVGEYTLSDGTVIYAIAPGRFVLLNPGPVSTSPYIALLF